MLPSILNLALFPLAAQAANIVMSNDDGWAEVNIRAFYDSLTAAGDKAIISAPASDQSGSSSLDSPPTIVTNGCEFSSCPSGAPAVGFNASQPNWHYVNSHPVTAMKYGVQNLSASAFGGPPDLVVTGPNVGSNLGVVTLFSGTMGAASAAMDQLGIPGVAFSGKDGSQTGYMSPTPEYATIYAELAANFTSTLIEKGAPYLESGIFLNVNYPSVGSGTNCTSVCDFKYVLSRIYASNPLSSKDVEICGNEGKLVSESEVIDTKGCYASVSVGHAHTKMDANATMQQSVLDKLGDFLTCLP